MGIKLLFTILTIIISSNLYAQSNDHSESHEHHQNEIGIANAPVYFVKEKVFAYAFHIHYVRNIQHTELGIGIAYERIFDEHRHNSLGVEMVYRPIENFSLSLSPGIAFEDGNPAAYFALHQETTYEFEIKNFHIGPVLEFAFDREDIHISLGFHIGYGF